MPGHEYAGRAIEAFCGRFHLAIELGVGSAFGQAADTSLERHGASTYDPPIVTVRFLILLCIAFVYAPSVEAQDREVPYWATIRASELNMRVGPSADYKIDWVYRRPGLPVKVIRIMEGWRLIEDPDGTRGWVVARLLSPDRGAIVVGDDIADILESPEGGTLVKWRVEPGVIGLLGDCEDDWCEFAVGEHGGFIRKDSLWGAGEP